MCRIEAPTARDRLTDWGVGVIAALVIFVTIRTAAHGLMLIKDALQ